MKIFVFVIFAVSLPNSYALKYIKDRVKIQKIIHKNDSLSSRIVFPKDRKISGRIIGGDIVSPYVYPFQVFLKVIRSHHIPTQCGGTLISTSWVLTAAHCLVEHPDYVVVVMGDVLITEGSTKPTTVKLVSTTYTLHEGYKESFHVIRNDIALVKLPRSVPVSQHINTVAYAKGDESYENYIGTTLGWGRTTTGENSYILREVSNPILPHDQCDIPGMMILPEHVCLSGKGIVGACFGDSGGPLLVNELQIGITSFGDSNCNKGYPMAFAKVAYFKDWIRTHAVDGSDSYRNLHRSIIMPVLCYWLKCMYVMVIF